MFPLFIHRFLRSGFLFTKGLLWLGFLVSAIQAQSFTHPGIPLTIADLDALKANLTKEPWASGYAALLSDSHSQLTYTMQGPYASVSRNPHVRRNEWMNDMQAAWNLSRLWYFTGNTAYAQKARDILVGWASGTGAVDPTTGQGAAMIEFIGNESNLDLGDYAYRYGGAASILRGTWPGWAASDTTAVKSLFANVYWPGAFTNGDALGPANKGMLTLAAGAAIAVFNDDQTKFDTVLRLYRTGGECALLNTLSSGEIGETGRDQGHAYGQWFSMAFLAEVFWKQGVDVYSEMDNRLLAIGEYHARFNLGLPTPFVSMGTTDWLYLTNTTAVWPNGGSGYNLLHGAYVVRKGLRSPYIEQFRAGRVVDMDNFVFFKTADSSTATPPAPFVYPAHSRINAGLNDVNIGSPSPTGASAYSEGQWTLTSTGTNMQTHGNDNVGFTYKQVTGDFTMMAKVESVTAAGSGTARAGLMFRNSLSASASQRAWVAVTTDAHVQSYLHGWTNVRGGSNWEYRDQTLPQSVYWVKIERIGNRVNTYSSLDGASWACSAAGEFNNLGAVNYVGLCATSANTILSNVSVTGGNGAAPVAVPIAPVAILGSPGDARVPLRWFESFGATGYTIKRSAVSGGPYTLIATLSGTSYVDTSVANGYTYYYVIVASNALGAGVSSPEESVILPAPQVELLQKLTGTIIGSTTTSWNNDPATRKEAALDGLASTAFDAPTASGHWVGLDLGSPQVVAQVRYIPRNGNASRMVGGLFQASNSASFSSGVVTLYTVPSAPIYNLYTQANVTGAVTYRYVRYLSPTNGFCNVAEIEFYKAIPPAAPTGVIASPVSATQIALGWAASSGATSYKVMRATASGGPFTTIAAGVSVTSYLDTGLSAVSTYYYRVSAVGDVGEGAASVVTFAITHSLAEDWRLAYFDTTVAGGDAADLADPDGDGMVNLLEYALGTSPVVGDSVVRPVLGRDEAGHLIFSFNRIADPGLVYEVQATADLVVSPWPEIIWASTGANNVTGPVVVTDTVALSGIARRFLRLSVTAP
ncbi:MAG: hypothetical protein RIQ79_824 [Verrucomicrobiota bacterium]